MDSHQSIFGIPGGGGLQYAPLSSNSMSTPTGKARTDPSKFPSTPVNAPKPHVFATPATIRQRQPSTSETKFRAIPPPVPMNGFPTPMPSETQTNDTPGSTFPGSTGEYTQWISPQLTRNLLLYAGGGLLCIVHALCILFHHRFLPSLNLLWDGVSPGSWVHALFLFGFGIFPLMLWKQYTYRTRRVAPPRPSWAILALFESPHLMSLALYWVSGMTLSRMVLLGQAWWMPFQ
jgi:hypothetical protein